MNEGTRDTYHDRQEDKPFPSPVNAVRRYWARARVGVCGGHYCLRGVDIALRLAVLKDIGPVVARSWRVYDAQPRTL